MVDLTQIGLEEIASSFDSKGYELFIEKRVPVKMSVEEMIVSALVARHERLVEGVPVLLVKNKIDYERLKELIEQYGVWNEFGYLGKFTAGQIWNKELAELVQYCKKKQKKSAILSTLNEGFFKRSRTQEQKEWNLVGAPSYSSLEKQLRRYS